MIDQITKIRKSKNTNVPENLAVLANFKIKLVIKILNYKNHTAGEKSFNFYSIQNFIYLQGISLKYITIS